MQSAHAMKSAGPFAFENCIAALAQTNPLLAFAEVPTGIHKYWGESLGWPDWLLAGTGWGGPDELPSAIRLVDDLRLLANLIRHVDEEQLVEMLLEWPHYPGEAMILAAPDLHNALALVTEMTSRNNAHITMSYAKGGGHGVIRVRLSPLLGPFLPIHEKVILAVLFLLVRTVVGVGKDGPSDLSRVELGATTSHDLLRRILPCRVTRASSEPYVAIPADMLGRGGLAHDRDTWSRFVSMAKADPKPAKETAPIEASAIEAAIQMGLRNNQRAPQLSEIARFHKVSERTVGRHLARSGFSYREIVDFTRMRLATELLLAGGASVAQVSERLGFSDVSAFVRSFRRHFAVSPSRWRKAQGGVANLLRQGEI